MSTRSWLSVPVLVNNQKYALIGILFEKGKGQHILKNPLIIASIVEKVTYYTYPLLINFYAIRMSHKKKYHVGIIRNITVSSNKM